MSKSYGGDKHSTEGSSLENGLTSQEAITQKTTRDETENGQRPKCPKSGVSSDRGKFKMG